MNRESRVHLPGRTHHSAPDAGSGVRCAGGRSRDGRAQR
jgi:hypothetical protein